MNPTMPILNFIFNTTCNFFCLSAILVFLYCFYDTGFQWNWKKAIALLAFSLIDSVLMTFASFIYYTFWSLFSLVFQVAVAVYDYRGKKVKGFFRFLPAILLITLCTVSITYAGSELIFPNTSWDELLALAADPSVDLSTYITACAEYFAEYLVDPFPDSVNLFLSIMNTAFFCPVFFYLYHRLYKHKISIKGKKGDLVFAIAYPVLCCNLGSTIPLLGRDNPLTLIFLTIMSILCALMLPVFAYYTRIGQHYRERTVYQESHMQTQLAHFTQYKQSQEETARFRHDIRNNLLCINEMLNTGNTEDAKQYLQELLHVASVLSPKFVSGDEMLDCILGVKATTMEEENIRFHLDGVLAGGLQWKSVDVCNVFANALDNAIEACRQLPEKQRQITMTIKATAQYWFVTIQNPAPADVDIRQLFLKTGGFTSKSDPDQHGIGTYTMKTTVESYGGMLKADCTDDLFTLEIMIDKSSSL